MFAADHYVPIIKGKRGEYDALRDLDAATRDGLTPLIEIPPVPWDFVADQQAKDLDSHLAACADRLHDSWPAMRPFFIDVLCDDAGLTGGGLHCVEHLVGVLEADGLTPVPVTSPARNLDYQAAVSQAVAHHGRGVCIRVSDEDVDDPVELARVLNELLAEFNLTRDSVDLVIDLGGLVGTPARALELAARAAVTAVPHPNDWRTLTVSMAAFPESVSNAVATNTTGTVRREDAIAYRRLVSKALPRTPTYSDYGADNPEYVEIDPRFIRPAAHIRHTTNDEWAVHRGGALRGPGSAGFAQFHALAADVVAAPYFAGSVHCEGDRFIEACASGGEGPGNLTTWRSVATNHHLSLVVESLSTRGVP